MSAFLVVAAAACIGAQASEARDDATAKPQAPAEQPAAADQPVAADAAAVAKLAPEERVRRLRSALKRIEPVLSALKSVRGRFVQTKRLEVFGRDVETRGTFALRMPDMFRWETTEPVRSELVVRGASGVRRRTSRKGDLTEAPFELSKDPVTSATVQQVFLWTTGRFAKASETYSLELLSEAPLSIRAVPTDEGVAKVIRSVEVEFSGEPVHLSRVALAEQAGTSSVLRFVDVEHDPDLPDSLFALEPAVAK